MAFSGSGVFILCVLASERRLYFLDESFQLPDFAPHLTNRYGRSTATRCGDFS